MYDQKTIGLTVILSTNKNQETGRNQSQLAALWNIVSFKAYILSIKPLFVHVSVLWITLIRSKKGKDIVKERERDREREKDRERKKEREWGRERDRGWERESEKEIEGERERETEMERGSERDKEI